MKITFSIHGYPQSVNSMWKRGRHGGVFLSAKARAWKEEVAWNARLATRGVTVPMKDLWSISITYYFADKRRRDAHNCDKLIFDALEGVIYDNDCQLVKWKGLKKHGEPRVEITLETC